MNRVAPVLLALSLGAVLPGARAQAGGEMPSVRMVRGHVAAVDRTRRLVVLKHDEIPSLDMPEMQMEYVVPDGADFPELSAGDKVRFAVVRVDGRHVITRVAALPPARRAAPRRGLQDAARSDP